MHVRMTEKEVKEAIRDWLDKHGVAVTEKNEIDIRVKTQYSGTYRPGDVLTGTAMADISDIEQPIKDGPYR